MLYSEIIERILLETDESMVSASGAESQARFYFHGALGDLLQGGEYRTEEILQLVVLAEYTFSGSEDGKLALSALTDDNIIHVKDVFPDIDGESGYIMSRESIDKLALYAYDSAIPPGGNQLKWFIIGQDIYIRPKASLTGEKFMFILVKSPLPWSSSPASGYWDDTTEMLVWFSYPFLNRAIMAAIERMRSSVG